MGKKLGVEVDCWGVGLILHQVYQRKWKLVDSCGDKVRMRPGMPSTKQRMEQRLQEAMQGLLIFETSSRWSLDRLSQHLKEDEMGDGFASYLQPLTESAASQQFVKRFRTGRPPLSAFAAYISERHQDVIGKTVGDLALRSKFGTVVLLVDHGHGKSFEKCPDPSTLIRARSWMYFGVRAGEEDNIDKAVDGISAMISGTKSGCSSGPLKRANSSSNTDDKYASSTGSRASRVVDGPSELLAFTLEFDCFTFPSHIGQKARLGPPANADQHNASALALDMRRRFKLNVAGILRQGAEEPEWFPGPAVEVSAGDLGLVVRRPQKDGSTSSTVMDEDLNELMDKALFAKSMKA
jgi:hypothetical protein